jgi:hypothetical protein
MKKKKEREKTDRISFKSPSVFLLRLVLRSQLLLLLELLQRAFHPRLSIPHPPLRILQLLIDPLLLPLRLPQCLLNLHIGLALGLKRRLLVEEVHLEGAELFRLRLLDVPETGLKVVRTEAVLSASIVETLAELVTLFAKTEDEDGRIGLGRERERTVEGGSGRSGTGRRGRGGRGGGSGGGGGEVGLSLVERVLRVGEAVSKVVQIRAETDSGSLCSLSALQDCLELLLVLLVLVHRRRAGLLQLVTERVEPRFGFREDAAKGIELRNTALELVDERLLLTKTSLQFLQGGKGAGERTEGEG